MGKLKRLIRRLRKQSSTAASSKGTKSSASDFPEEASESARQLLANLIANELTLVSPQRLWATYSAADYVCINGIPGDFVECGVWRGGNSIAAASAFREHQADKQVHLFDTFESGFDASEPEDPDVPTSTRRQLYGHSTLPAATSASYLEEVNAMMLGEPASVAFVRKMLAQYGVEEICRIVAGDVNVTLREPENVPEAISVLRLDTDFYSSTRTELEVLYPRISSGGVVLIDDYGHWEGAKRAVDEYFEGCDFKPLKLVTDTTGRALVKI